MNTLDHHAHLTALLGDFPPHAFVIERAEDLSAIGYRCLRLHLMRHDGTSVRAFLTGPEGEWQSRPAILYCHAHGNKYAIGAQELLDGRPALFSVYAKPLADAGLLALAIDLPCFGDRGQETESAAAKRHGWFGRTLFGEMIADLRGALDLLAQMPEVDASRIGVFGLSMGATLAYWIAALEPRLKAVAQLCAFADIEALIASGAHDLHGPYMTIPGLLPDWPAGRIAGMIAPRAQVIGMGAEDPLTPPDAAGPALEGVAKAYSGCPVRLSILIAQGSGHVETPAMREAVLALFAKELCG